MKRTNESGRSMVEMLGVLAIIGVLSIGGIAGYTMAMNRYRANEIIDSVNKYAVIAYTACQTARTMRGSGLGQDGCTVGTDFPSYDDSGLIAESVLGGGGVVTIGDAVITVRDDNVGAQDSYTTVDLTFTNNDICKAAASTAGTVCSGNTFTYRVRNS